MSNLEVVPPKVPAVASDEPSASAAERSTNLRARAIKSGAWYASTRLWTQTLSWGVTIVLARLLTPADYGLYGMAIVVIGFLELFQHFGLGVAIIQRQDLSRAQLAAVSWVVVGFSTAMFVVTYCLAGPVAVYYAEPRLVWLVRVLGLLFLIGALGAVPYSLLTREIDFRRRSHVEASGVVPGAIASITLAFCGAGVWALVGGEGVRAVTRMVTLFYITGWRPSLDVSFRDMRSLLGFGTSVAGATMIGELSRVLEAGVLGRFLGSQAFGLYSMAVTLGVNPFSKLTTAVINQLSLPVFATIQRDLPRLRTSFLTITRYLALISMPMQVGVALVAADFVSLVLSDTWRPMVFLLQILSIGGIWQTLLLPAGPLLTARGRVRMLLGYNIGYAIVMPSSFFVGAQFGLTGVAIAWLVAFCTLRSVLGWIVMRELDVRFTAWLAQVAAPTMAASALAVAILALRQAWPLAGTPVPGLIRDVSCGGVVYLTVLLLVDRRLPAELKGIWDTLVAKQRA